MNRIRRAYIMAHLVNRGKIHRRDIVSGTGCSQPCATGDLREFQILHGKLDYDPSTRTYHLPDGYNTVIDLSYVNTLIDEILEYRARRDEGEGI
jgi:hypothetical protein